tara:strand:+ start:691 stop:1407 length:717 start_codon:yes stop_codon:yes gene_type:complete
MANYVLQNTASEIDNALSKVSSPTTSLTNIATSDTSLVTSGAVKAAIDNISVGSTLTVDSFATAALETSTDTLTDTDTAIPTSAAVKGFVGIPIKAASILRTPVFQTSSTSYQVVPVTHSGDSFLSVNNNITTVPAGTYLMQFSFEYSDTGYRQDNGYGAYFKVEQISGPDFHGLTADNQTGAGTNYASGTTYTRRNLINTILNVSSTSSFRLLFKSDFRTSDYHRIQKLQWHFIKLY